MIQKNGFVQVRRTHRASFGCWIVLALLVSTEALAQDWSIDWYTIDGGGELLSKTADQQWQLSGTLGQWDSTGSLALSQKIRDIHDLQH